MITGIVVALPEELSSLTAKRIDKGHCVFIADRLLAAYLGAGAKNAAAAAELLIGKGASQLISWGCAAALSPHLKPGDLLLADALIDVDDNHIAVDAGWHHHARRLLAPITRLHCGKLTESANIVISGKEKQQLHGFTQALAVDMESVAIAKVATARKRPFLAIRTIVDPVTMDLPRAIAYAANSEGDIELGRLLLFLALHPTGLPQLVRLGFYFNRAKSTLKRISRCLDELADIKTT